MGAGHQHQPPSDGGLRRATSPAWLGPDREQGGACECDALTSSSDITAEAQGHYRWSSTHLTGLANGALTGRTGEGDC